MVRLCFICETPFQIMNCLNYMYHQTEFSDVVSDIYIGDKFYQFNDIVKRLQDESVFDHVYGYNYDIENGKISHYKNKINEIFFPKKYIQSLVTQKIEINKKLYDYIYISVTTHFGIAMVLGCPKARVRYYDDGLASYIGYIGPRYLPEKRKILYKIAGKDYWRLQPEALYVNNKKFCRSELTDNIQELFPVAESSKEFKQILYRIFDYQQEKLYDQKQIVYLSQPNEADDANEKKVLKILDLYKEFCMIRIHPRQNNAEYDDFAIDQQRGLWELVCVEQIHDDHVLIGQFSTAQVVPKLLFEKEPWLIFTYKLYIKDNSNVNLDKIETMIMDLKNCYEKPDKIFVIENMEQLEKTLSDIITIYQ